LVLIPERNETIFKCSKNTLSTTIIANLRNGEKEIVAFYTNSSCIGFGNSECSQNNIYNYLRTVNIDLLPSISSYVCENYIFYDERHFVYQGKKIICLLHSDLTTVSIKLIDGTFKTVGLFKNGSKFCSLDIHCYVDKNRFIVHTLNKTKVIESYTCSSFLLNSEESNAVSIPDENWTTYVTMTCPRINSSMSLTVVMNDGKSMQYASYHNDYCSTLRKAMMCSSTFSSYLLTFPVFKESRNITSFSCFENITDDIVFYSDSIHIKCTTPIITREKLSIKCHISNVYTSINCSLFNKINLPNVMVGHFIDKDIENGSTDFPTNLTVKV
uniref:Uncharacterized protein n=1 Tax=Biomphalaria glabrata TaxID=6526 RepID=A0A2C9LVF8_BIOGL